MLGSMKERCHSAWLCIMVHGVDKCVEIMCRVMHILLAVIIGQIFHRIRCST